jgi:hypothetical protein
MDNTQREAAKFIAAAVSPYAATEDLSFKVQGGAQYIYRPIDAELASYFGCPGANAVLVGRHGHIVGTATAVTGRSVKVPGWPGWQRGKLTVFNFADESLKGWVSDCRAL